MAILAPNPLLAVTIEAKGSDGDDVHLHPGGQGVWVARMAAELGAETVVCGLIGGETGAVLGPLLEHERGEPRLVETAGNTGCYVIDRRSGERRLISDSLAEPPSRHEADELFSIACAAALESAALVVCNPYPDDGLPLEFFADLVADARANGTPVLADLSTPRLDSALEADPDVVKINSWELSEFASSPVDSPEQLMAAARRLHESGAGTVVITRGAEPALVLADGEAWELVPPRFERGSREGCGDSMMGALAVGWARGLDRKEALVLGAATGAASFLRHGLGTATRDVVESLIERVELRPA
ncbi:MAG TPA: PfkB family carbohydrate kinase [Solirubrobacterales bacterium]|nr:PfkB family carbohydrate kinase [Solirubrobacterales bacterium]